MTYRLNIKFRDRPEYGKARIFNNFRITSKDIISGNEDEFIFNKSNIEIIMVRDFLIDVGSFFSEENISVHESVEKSLLVFYGAALLRPSIEKITLTRVLDNGQEETKKISEYKQPVERDETLDAPYGLDNNEYVKSLFKNDSLSKAIKEMLSNWIMSYYEKNNYVKFDKIYRALNSIIGYLKESKGIESIKVIIDDNKDTFKLNINQNLYESLKLKGFLPMDENLSDGDSLYEDYDIFITSCVDYIYYFRKNSWYNNYVESSLSLFEKEEMRIMNLLTSFSQDLVRTFLSNPQILE